MGQEMPSLQREAWVQVRQVLASLLLLQFVYSYIARQEQLKAWPLDSMICKHNAWVAHILMSSAWVRLY